MFEKCLRCGRALSNPVSQKRGYGPVCARKVQREAIREDVEAQVVFEEKGKNEQIRELKEELAALKIIVHNKLASMTTHHYKPPPTGPTTQTNSIPLMVGGWDVSELQTNPLFLHMKEVAG
ncbi:MAG: hypothetical protein KAQ99_10200 [Candidatus Aureabacteria bacterium]|nr:hypothetical protein [Candidatus Auribacterota bacterium]